MSEGYDGLPAYYSQSSDPLTPNYGFSLKGMDPIIAENFVLADTAIAAGGAGKWATLKGDLTETQVIPFDGPTVGTPDTGISRIGTGSLAIGNGTTGDFSGSIKVQDITLTDSTHPFQAFGSWGAGWWMQGLNPQTFGDGTFGPFIAYNASSGQSVAFYDTNSGTQWRIGANGTLQSVQSAPLVFNSPADSGLSRLAAASLAIGNGTAGDFSGSLKLAEVNFGTNPATTGPLNFPNNSGIYFRNATNNGDVRAILVDSSNNINIGSGGNPTAQINLAISSGNVIQISTSGIACSEQMEVNLTSGGSSVSGLLCANTTASTSTLSQSSPVLSLNGTYWNGSASAVDSWTLFDSVANGTNGASTLTIAQSGSSGAAQVAFPQGAQSSPSISFSGRLAQGLFSNSASSVGLLCGVGGGFVYFGATSPLLGIQCNASPIIASQGGGSSLTISGNTSTTNAVFLSSSIAFNGSAASGVANVQGTLTQSSGSSNFFGLSVTPTINQTGSATSIVRVLAAYPVNTSLLGNEYLLALGTTTATGVGGTLTDKFLVDNNGTMYQINQTVGTPSSTNASPLHLFEANYYSGSLSETDTWSIGSILGQGVNGSSLLEILHSGSTGQAGVLIGNSQFTTSAENSPYLILAGSYEVSASAGSFAEDNWYFQNVIGGGANGASTLTISHSGSTGTATLSIPNGITLTGGLNPVLSSTSISVYSGTGNIIFSKSGVGAVAITGSFSGGNGCGLPNGYQYGWVSSSDYTGNTMDTCLSRISAGVVGIGTSSSNKVAGQLNLATILMTAAASAPTSAGTAGTAGQVIMNGGNLYLCTVTGAAGSASWIKLSGTAV